ncbi:hypothetical protein PR048_004212 [Dryococelus australis]|uniref:DDE-1 domain-containing protein n=1 Tax=Dryococelus australis TaxID=614101 RepID=A0ABQ9I6S2_9NEOP|nr:hypothetical protein PR048_004212 [Dryococelus australis]
MKKMCVKVMLGVLSDGRKLTPYVILKGKTVPTEKLPSGVIVRCQDQGRMTGNLTKYWLKVVWERKLGAMLRKRGMFVLDSFKGHLTPDVKNTAQDLNTDLVVIPGGITSQLQVLDVPVNNI